MLTTIMHLKNESMLNIYFSSYQRSSLTRLIVKIVVNSKFVNMEW